MQTERRSEHWFVEYKFHVVQDEHGLWVITDDGRRPLTADETLRWVMWRENDEVLRG